MTILRLHPLAGSSLLVLAIMLGLPAVGAHCAGEGFPNRQVREKVRKAASEQEREPKSA